MKFMIVDESYKASTELSYEEPTQITTITSSKIVVPLFSFYYMMAKRIILF